MKLPLLTLTAALALALPSAHSAEPRKKTPRATPAPDTTPAGEPKEPRTLTGRALPYKVKITALDEPAATFSSAGKGGTVNVFAITDKTTITRDTQPATFADLAVGSIVTGSRTRALNGKWEVATVNIQGVAATPKPRGKKEPVKPAAKKPDEPKPAKKPEAAPAPAPTDTPKTTEPAAAPAPAPAPAPAEPPKTTEITKPEPPKPETKPEEKRVILR